jgi:UDP-2,3-diacylglucosamine pyrophosphatase LpxH
LRILVISDLHAGHRSSRAEEALPILSKLAGECDQVIVNGDALERWEKDDCEPSFAVWRERLVNALAAQQGPPVFITGNHDPAISDKDWFYDQDGRTLIFHGDFISDCSAPWRDGERELAARLRLVWSTRGGPPDEFAEHCALFRRTQREFMNPWPFTRHGGYDPLRYLARNLFPPWRPWTIVFYRLRAAERIRTLAEKFSRPTEHIVFGHIHWPGHWEKKGVSVWNTGSFMPFSKPSPVLVDGKKLRQFSFQKLSGKGFK